MGGNNSYLEGLVRDNYPSYSARYPRLVSIFDDYANSIRDAKQKETYVFNAGKMLSSTSRSGIPQGILTELPHPEMVPYVRKQACSSSCGTSCVRTVLLLNYGVMLEEEDMWKLKKKNGGYDIVNGTTPVEIADIIRHVHSQGELIYKDQGIDTPKVFMSCKGSPKQLRYLVGNGLLPIINRPCYEEGVGNHYEVVLGLNKDFVYLHNPANSAQTRGFHRIKLRKFMEKWWRYDGKNEHWYTTVIPETKRSSLVLPKSASRASPAFIGKYV